MDISVAAAARQLEERGLLKRNKHDQSDRVVPHVQDLLGRVLPRHLELFYRENIQSIIYCTAFRPVWNSHVGWKGGGYREVTELLHVDAVPIFSDDFGNRYGVFLGPGVDDPAVYFFNHDFGWDRPEYAAGSSIAKFMLVLADEPRAYEENWPERWQLSIDPDIDKCPRAPPIWDAPRQGPYARDGW